MENIRKLPLSFIGTGEVKGFKFTLKKDGDNAYIYEVKNGNMIYYEVFLKKYSPICLDFKNKIYSDTELKEIYPNSKHFGIWAFCKNTYESALVKFNELNLNV